MLDQAQAYPKHIMYLAFEKGELVFKNNVNLVSINDIPANTNFISRHTIYKIKIV